MRSSIFFCLFWYPTIPRGSGPPFRHPPSLDPRQTLMLNDYLVFYVPLRNISLIWRRHHYRWRAAKFRPMLGAQGLRAGRDFYRATPAVTRGLGFSGLIRMTTPFSRLLRHARGCWGPILSRIPTGSFYLRKKKGGGSFTLTLRYVGLNFDI